MAKVTTSPFISVINDANYINIKFKLQGYMTAYQQYRKEGCFTDVKIHCFHPNSGDLSIYSAHSMILSTSCSSFSTLLIKPFIEITKQCVYDLKRNLGFAPSEDLFRDQVYSGQTEITFYVKKLYDGYYLHNKHDNFYFSDGNAQNIPKSVKDMNNYQNIGNEKYFNKSNDVNSIFPVIFKVYHSQNTTLLVVKGLDPLIFRYILCCAYSEDFSIEKCHISLFLSLINKVELINCKVLSELLYPFINDANINGECFNNLSYGSYLNSFNLRDEYIILNSASDVALHSSVEKNDETCTPIDLSCKSKTMHKFERKNKHDYTTASSAVIVPTMEASNIFGVPGRNSTSNTVIKTDTEVVYTIIKFLLYPYANACDDFSSKKGNAQVNKVYPDSLIYWNSEYANEALSMNKGLSKDEVSDGSSNHLSVGLLSEANISNHVLLKETVYFHSEENSILHINTKGNVDSFESMNKDYKKCGSERKKCKFGSLSFDSDAFSVSECSLPLKKKAKVYDKSSESALASIGFETDMMKIKKKKNASHSSSIINFASPNEPDILISDSLKKLEQNSAIEIQRLNLNKKFSESTKTESNTFVSKKELAVKHTQVISSQEELTRESASIKVENSIAQKIGSEIIATEQYSETVSKSEVFTKKINRAKSKEIKIKQEIIQDDFSCMVCEFNAPKFETVIVHAKSEHFTENVRIAKCLDSRCPVQLLFCSKEWETHLQHHIVTFHFRCSICSYSTKTSIGIMRHEMVHNKGNRKKCQYGIKNTDKKAIKGEILKRNERPVSKLRSSHAVPKQEKASPVHSKRLMNKTERSNSSSCNAPGNDEIRLDDVLENSLFLKFEQGIYARRKLHSLKLNKYFSELTKDLFKMKLPLGNEGNQSEGKVDASASLSPKEKVKSDSCEVKELKAKGGRSEDPRKSETSSLMTGFSKLNSSCDNVQKIKTRTVKLPKKKRKLFTCNFCDMVLSSKEGLAKHYYHFHRFILPFNCPFRGCDVHMDNTSHLYTHVTSHSLGSGDEYAPAEDEKTTRLEKADCVEQRRTHFSKSPTG